MEIYTWSWPVALPAAVAERMLVRTGRAPLTAEERDTAVVINAGALELTIGKKDGLLKRVVNEKGEIPFNNGPVLSGGESVFKQMEIRPGADSLQLVCSYGEESRMKELLWTVYPSGWVKLDISYFPPEYDVHFEMMGVNFSYPESQVKSVRWLGQGPYRVWKNRMQGVELRVHQKDYNKTMTGVPPLVYPEFKGYHAGLYWAEIRTTGQPFRMATATEDVFLRLFTPDQPEKTYNTAPVFPAGDISFMQGIPPIGTKSQQAWRLGPSGQKNQFFDYGPYDDWRRRCKKMILLFDFTAN
jgi:hypothetical protein